MNLLSTIFAYGTSEGAERAWDTRGRGRKEKELSDRAARARASYNPATKEKQRIAEANEKWFAQLIGGQQTHDNSPFDVIKNKFAVEVKTIFPGVKNDKITCHPVSCQRKKDFAGRFKMKDHMFIKDERDGKLYLAKGVGSFRLGRGSTQEMTPKDLKRYFA